MLKRIGQAFILNRLHIIAGAPAIMWCWSQFLKMRFRLIDYLIITLTVACICQWNRLTDIAEDTLNCPDDLKDAQAKRRYIRFFCYTGGTIAVFSSLFTGLAWNTAGLVSFGAAVGYFYNTPLLPSRPHLRLKNIFIIKNMSSGAGWSSGLLIYPMLRAHEQPDWRFCIAFVYMFAMVMTYEIMWDIRDMEGDARAGIKSVPVVLGINKARIFAVVLQLICLGIIMIGLVNASLAPVWSVYLLPCVMILMLIIFFPQLIRSNRGLSHVLIVALGIFACFGGFLANRFG